jgi:hypothetical protein
MQVFAGAADAQTIDVPPGTFLNYQSSSTGDGVATLKMIFYSKVAGQPLDFTVVNPAITDVTTLVNQIPAGADRTFQPPDWQTQGPNIVTLTQGQIITPPGVPREPQLMLSWSDDGGHTFSNEYTLNCGQAGQFLRRAIRRRLGKSRGRNFKIAASDPVPWRIVDAYIPPAQERYEEQTRKIT